MYTVVYFISGHSVFVSFTGLKTYFCCHCYGLYSYNAFIAQGSMLGEVPFFGRIMFERPRHMLDNTKSAVVKYGFEEMLHLPYSPNVVPWTANAMFPN